MTQQTMAPRPGVDLGTNRTSTIGQREGVTRQVVQASAVTAPDEIPMRGAIELTIGVVTAALSIGLTAYFVILPPWG
jgi:hypothetical protein